MGEKWADESRKVQHYIPTYKILLKSVHKFGCRAFYIRQADLYQKCFFIAVDKKEDISEKKIRRQFNVIKIQFNISYKSEETNFWALY